MSKLTLTATCSCQSNETWLDWEKSDEVAYRTLIKSVKIRLIYSVFYSQSRKSNSDVSYVNFNNVLWSETHSHLEADTASFGILPSFCKFEWLRMASSLLIIYNNCRNYCMHSIFLQKKNCCRPTYAYLHCQ